MDDFFDIYGSYHAQMMYPGDLNGGAENVANCKCWLNYTNQKPQELKTRGTFKISNNVELKPTDKPKTKTEAITSKQETTALEPKPKKPKITEKIKTTIKNKFKEIKFNIKYRDILKFKKEFHDYSTQFKKEYKNTQNHLKKMYTTPNNLTKYEKIAIKRWGKDSGPLVNYLRNISQYLKDEYFERYHSNLINAISKYDNIKVNTLLHRRVSNDFYIVEVGEIGTFDTPTSTTFNSYDNEEYGEFHISVLAPEGSNGAYIEELMEGNTTNNHLNEWLLPTGTEYITLVKDYDIKEAIILLQ